MLAREQNEKITSVVNQVNEQFNCFNQNLYAPLKDKVYRMDKTVIQLNELNNLMKDLEKAYPQLYEKTEKSSDWHEALRMIPNNTNNTPTNN